VKFIDRQSDNQHLASNFMGKSVQNNAGEKIGTVKDILFDDKGSMTAIIIGFGGFLGIGEKSVGIPFEMVKTSKDANGNLIVVASLDKDAINAAPDFLTLEDVKARAPTAPGASPANPSRP
jgi:sporulation protein YlmC with PRC-barrel domain